MTTRRWPRISLVLHVTVRMDEVDDAIAAETLNVSREGLFIAMDPPVAVGTRVRVRIELGGDGSEAVTAEGVVVRRHPDPDEPGTMVGRPGVGVFLTATGPGYEKWVDELGGKAK